MLYVIEVGRAYMASFESHQRDVLVVIRSRLSEHSRSPLHD